MTPSQLKHAASPPGCALIHVTQEDQVCAAYLLMRQLRPQLESVQAWVAYWQRAQAAGYRLWMLVQDEEIVALASYRVQENIVHGVHLYVEDLVTDDAVRSHGFGQILMDMLKEQARASGCGKIVLDTPLSNTLGHRFYYRQGLLAGALRFNQVLEG